jgi:L-lactate dehydrogenase (cytochrome)
VYAVAARGEKGVEHILRIIHEEIRVTLGLTGFTNVQELNRSALVDP